MEENMKENTIGQSQREIKFRAWDKNHNKMVYFGSENDATRSQYTVGDILYLFELFEDEDIMQYTGLKDKNGVEIYEGDVVKYNNGKKDIYRIIKRGKYEDSGGMYYIEYHGYQDCSYTEIVGNIYENPELLSEK